MLSANASVNQSDPRNPLSRRAKTIKPTNDLGGKEICRRVQGVVEDEKLEILRTCAIGFCRKPYLMLDLAKEFLLCGLRDRWCYSCLLMQRREDASLIVDVWILGWITLWLGRQTLNCRIGEFGYDESSKSPTEFSERESLKSIKEIRGDPISTEVMVEDTLVPESLEDISSVQVRRMWEGNAREDMRVREVSSTIENWSTDEVAGCIDRLDAANTSVDIVEEAEVFEHRDARLLQSEKQILTNSPDLSVGRRMYGPRSEIARVNKLSTMFLNGQQKRVRQISEISLRFLVPNCSYRGGTYGD
ncbi:hypothetical protein V6N12_009835 [Hibiscus sabdariffa]|uniref:Uncharacterized protein n=1 Tax=Hibiscus sabdariffa TaxID=183260 RepID=A0ABR2EDE2_9ROSI